MAIVTIVAFLKAREGKEQQLRKELLKVVVPSRAEEGCLEYVLHESPEHPEQFVFYESWKDEIALQEHLASPHYQAYRQATEALLDTREVHRLNKLTM
ncbi:MULTISPECIES: putative quinol monooxygenase [unclassified Paenibacillus]|uniref:putative quinol monooxygenase n=1 Tax=unclassified Paenibacillus TaxID=185978 RepID=UPI002406A024|nr:MULTISPECIES: putative quinol monooxygenase [unclassified Paenibacillus]MDF9845358.1 quinol monooxygenase YgiN [Paenibacillus sp. PastF-2]MDF9851957.1 quinol monooxygenase YgiN [Paenibacillus sp. PastM-2]MDF9858521.1 quinol monooxygenase YgiN [Paenibacillus sp. PastF-1]MDH6483770.1 quinol monooxygenase YgiN [Paenibacillus sp. PastH-2]MDH6511168.1 quinol monooxygenase YgiN [Paenibacillus sp. PastM-3]